MPARPDARLVALRALKSLTRGRVAERLDQLVAGLAPAERALARTLALGVVRRRLTLDHLLRGLTGRDRPRLKPPLSTALQLGAFQLLFTDRIPAAAAINETVNLARREAGEWAAPLANGILRNLARLAGGRGRRADHPPERCLPLDGDSGIVFARPVFPPAANRPRHLAAVHSHPEWLIARWLKAFGEAATEAILLSDNRPPPLSIRVNRLRTDRDQLAARWRQAGIAVEPGAEPAALRPRWSGPVNDLPGYAAGLFSVQDESAQAAGAALGAAPGELVLDLCAAPGGKAAHLAELAGGEARLLLADSRPERLARAKENFRRLGHRGWFAAMDGARPALPDRPLFDRVLLDVPCTNTGVLRRRVEARWRVTPRSLAAAARLSRALLGQAWPRLKPGGRLLYSTCSLEAEENESLVEAFLAETPGLKLEAQRLILPGADAGGGYWALISHQT